MYSSLFQAQPWLFVDSVVFFNIWCTTFSFIGFVIDLFIFICRIDPMEEGGFWTNMIIGDDDVAGLEDLKFSMTQDTEQIYEMPSEVQEVDMPVTPLEGAPRSRGSRPFSKRTKNFDPKEDLVVCSAWLNVSKDPIHGASQSRSSFWGRVRAYFEKHKTTPLPGQIVQLCIGGSLFRRK
jgi:hypothetical protein